MFCLSTSQLLPVAQTIISFGTLLVIVLYTIETRKLRRSGSEQLAVMWQTLNLERQRDILAAEPIFRWSSGDVFSDDTVRWDFENLGGGVSRVTIEFHGRQAGGLYASINRTDYIAPKESGWATFSGPIDKPFEFRIGYKTAVGRIAGVIFQASRTQKPMETGSFSM